jgi:stage III sporulation protein SpoIIIAA
MSEKIINEELQALLDVLPVRVREHILHEGRTDELIEVVMDLGRRPSARYVDGESPLGDEEVTRAEIDAVVHHIESFDDDNRAGIERTLHRIAGIRNRRGEIVGLTCRIGRAVFGTLEIIEDIVEEGVSVLLLGRPGVGKTTILREMARVLSETKRVVIVDTSNEIGGDGDIPHPAVGRARRMQVPRPSHQHETMIEAVENHNPQVIIIDEIGRQQEAAAARTINERGVQLVGTAHGNSLENLLLNPTLSDLVGGIESVTLSDDEARRRGTQKTVLERRAPPTFNVLIEIQERQRLVVHRDVAASVDAMLRDKPLNVELRFRDEEGALQVEAQQTLQTPVGVSRRNNVGGRKEQTKEAPRSRKNGAATLARPLPSISPRLVSEPEEKVFKIFSYGVARNRLVQSSKALGVKIELVDEVEEADVFVTLKSYYRRRRRVIADAEQMRKPVYVLRANSDKQIENFLVEALDLEPSRNSSDPFDNAIAEAEEAIGMIHAGHRSVDLMPAGTAIRRYQHQLARQANLVSHSYGNEPNRHVRIFSTPRNEASSVVQN